MNITEIAQQCLRKAAKDAIGVQDACNSSAVVFSFERAMRVLCEVASAENKGTDWKNNHPITFLFAHKIMSLAGHEDLSHEATTKYHKAYMACSEIAG